MPNNLNNDDSKLIDRDREVDEILEESKYLLDQEKMELTAQKYRAKQPVAEIFSNADKKPRLENSNPLDVDKEKAVNENEISGDKTATTLQAELVLEGTDDDYPSQQDAAADKTADSAKEEKEEKAKETESTETQTESSASAKDTENTETEDDEDEIVTLTPEYSEGTTFSQDILDDVDQFNDNETHIKSIHTIDIDITDDDTKPPKAPNEPQGQFDELFKTEEPDVKQHKKVIAKVPVYRKEGEENTLNVKAGKFSEVVGYEYEEYIKSKNPSVIAHVIKPDTQRTVIVEEDDEPEPLDFHSASEKIMANLVGFFSKDTSNDDDTPVKETEVVDDYMGEDDEKSIMQEINLNIKKLFGRTMLTGGLALVSIIITVLVRLFPQAICNAVFFAPVAYAVINFLLIGFSTFVNRVAIMSGLTPLAHFKGNSDTAVALAAVASVVQTVVSFFCLYGVTSFDINYYTVIVLVAFFANNLGKLLMVLRVKENFKFTAADGQRYAAKIYNNESVAAQMMSGTAVERPIIAYQHRTGFPSNFLKISYAPDPSEDLASKLAPATAVIAVVVALLYGIFFGSFSGAVNAFALVCAVCIPVSTLLAVNIPMYDLCKKLLPTGAMLSGYPSVKQFCDSTAVMIDANELFPADSVFLDGIKTFEDYNIDESLLCGIAILKEAQNPIAKVFEKVVDETDGDLPEVESVLYEDELGLVGWVNGERILVGNRELMTKYSVETPSIEYEDKYIQSGKQVTYVARAGRLIAMFVTHYIADSILMPELHRAEANGISILVHSTDCNITNDLICSLYNVFYRTVKVLPTGLGTVLKECKSTFEETSRAYLITNGKTSAFLKAVSGSVHIKRNISLSIVIQLISVVLGVLLTATLALYAGVGALGTLEVLIYSLFWGVATLVAPLIHKT
ncbi:hypothetical protein DXC23_11435 [Eubacterium sp. OM08-24]|uniref:hypothetical protein n=1 Tax=Eubacterium sp. OM08-24 TaxID=2292352 RepID=UPI000E439514|nr:hypothetical protein [Eubacterium sp. OM08-24]RGM17431.1 hypothetical protein DXC23_11435 [Eubacterium sp. OM08-24]